MESFHDIDEDGSANEESKGAEFRDRVKPITPDRFSAAIGALAGEYSDTLYQIDQYRSNPEWTKRGSVVMRGFLDEAFEKEDNLKRLLNMFNQPDVVSLAREKAAERIGQFKETTA